MISKNEIESVSLEIANYWTSSKMFQENNTNCGALIAFDWYGDCLSEINTNIDLHDLEIDNFKFHSLIYFIAENNFNYILGLRNVRYKNNPSESWTNKLKEHLNINSLDYDEYVVQPWPTSIPEFDVPDNIFILRYSFNPDNKIDDLAAKNTLFKDWILKSDWEDKFIEKSELEKKRVIVLVSDIENLVLHNGYVK